MMGPFLYLLNLKKPKKEHEITFEVVYWDDAFVFETGKTPWGSSQEFIDVFKDSNCERIVLTVGHVIYDSKNDIIICQSRDKGRDNFMHAQRIPKAMIKKRIVIEVPPFGVDD